MADTNCKITWLFSLLTDLHVFSLTRSCQIILCKSVGSVEIIAYIMTILITRTTLDLIPINRVCKHFAKGSDSRILHSGRAHVTSVIIFRAPTRRSNIIADSFPRGIANSAPKHHHFSIFSGGCNPTS